MATRAQLTWNRGRAGGPPAAPRRVETPGTCPTDGCGRLADTADASDPTVDGWVQIQVIGSREPDRLYCSGLCGHYGIALAQLRPATDGQEQQEQDEPAVPPAPKPAAYVAVTFGRSRRTHLTRQDRQDDGPVVALCGAAAAQHSRTSTHPLCLTCQKAAAAQRGGR